MTALKPGRLKPLFIAAMAAVGLLALSPLVRTCWQRATDSYWAAQIEQLPVDQAQDLVRQLAQQGGSLRLMVQVSLSHRLDVSSIAQQSLLAEIDSWHSGRADAKARATILAGALRASLADSDDDDVRSLCGVALAILDWLQANGEIDLSIAEDCQQVLIAASPALLRSQNELANSANVPKAPAGPDDADFPPLRQWQDFPQLAQLESAPAATSGETGEKADVQETATGGLNASAEPGPFQPALETRSLTSAAPGVLQVGQVGDDAVSLGTIAGDRVIRLASEVDSGDSVDPLLDVLHRHRSSGSSSPSGPSLPDELSDLDLSEVEVALFGELLSPIAARRRNVAEMLPGLRSIDNRRWLKLLAFDDDAEVRLTALTLLATTGDPALISFARSRAARDSDDRVRNQLGRQLNPETSR